MSSFQNFIDRQWLESRRYNTLSFMSVIKYERVFFPKILFVDIDMNFLTLW